MRVHWLLGSLLPLLALSACAPPAPVHFEMGPCAPASPDADGRAVIAGFYDAFSRHDFRGMACSYDPEIEFTDSIFGTLRGKRAFAMWAMLTSQGKDLKVQVSSVRGDATSGHAHWDAQYSFPFLMFTNDVDNHIEATFELRSGKIVRHKDEFDLPRWMSLALWPLGGAISEATIRDGVQKKLDAFIADHPQFQDPPAAAHP